MWAVSFSDRVNLGEILIPLLHWLRGRLSLTAGLDTEMTKRWILILNKNRSRSPAYRESLHSKLIFNFMHYITCPYGIKPVCIAVWSGGTVGLGSNLVLHSPTAQRERCGAFCARHAKFADCERGSRPDSQLPTLLKVFGKNMEQNLFRL